MKVPRLILILILLAIVQTALSVDKRIAVDTTEEAIINLNQGNFEHLVNLGKSERWFVMFHDGCPSCQEVYPIWNNFTKSRRGIRLGSLNATASSNIATKYDIKSFPSFVFFDEGKMELYQGENTVDAWNNYISLKKGANEQNQIIPDAAPQEDHIVELDRNNFDTFVLAQATRPWFIMFHTHCPECEAVFPSWHEFARSRKEGPNIGMVDCDKNPELSERFDIKSHPTFIYFEDGQQQIFNGERRVKSWIQYVDQKKNKDLAAEIPVVNITNKTASESPSQERLAPESQEKLPKPAIGNLNALNATIAAQNTTNSKYKSSYLTPGLPELTIGGLNALNRSSEVKEVPITTIEYERRASGATEARPSITVETMDRRPNEGRFEDNTIHYKEPVLVIGMIASLLLGSFFLFMCYQRFSGKYTPVDTMEHDMEAIPADHSTVRRDSFSHSMRF